MAPDSFVVPTYKTYLKFRYHISGPVFKYGTKMSSLQPCKKPLITYPHTLKPPPFLLRV